MKSNIWNDYAGVEKMHPWYLARRDLLIEWATKNLKNGESGIEIGSGTGYLASQLIKNSKVEVLATDINPLGVKAALNLGLKAKELNAEDISQWPDKKFDFLIAMDVLEHFENDFKALENAISHMVRNGTFFITVPAHKFLWSKHDIDNQHYRRYSKKQISNLLRSQGLKIEKIRYWNSTFLPIIYLQRVLLSRIFEQDTNESYMKVPGKLASLIIQVVLIMEKKFPIFFGKIPGCSIIVEGKISKSS